MELNGPAGEIRRQICYVLLSIVFVNYGRTSVPARAALNPFDGTLGFYEDMLPASSRVLQMTPIAAGKSHAINHAGFGSCIACRTSMRVYRKWFSLSKLPLDGLRPPASLAI